jgi:DNA-binding beta-propeller fold protein YncE
VAGGGKVYFEDGATIYETSTDLTGLQVFHVNGEAPTGLAIDPTAGVFYESFGADGVSALDLANPGFAVRFLGVSATNIVAGGGKVYFEDGATIYETSTDLTGLQVFHVNGEAPTGLALYIAPAAAAIPEAPTWAMLMLGVVGLGVVGHCRTKSVAALNAVARSRSEAVI